MWEARMMKDGIDLLIAKLETWGEQIILMLPNMLIAVVIISVFWALSRWIHGLLTRLFQRTHFNENLEQLLANIGRLMVLGLGFIICLSVLNLEKTVFSLLAGVGVIGLALGFAFQDLAANFMSGIMLALRSPIQIGDMIDIKGVRGRVREINLRDTVIRTATGQDVYMPNKEFSANFFMNFSKSGVRRIDLQVGVAYEDDSAAAVEVVERAVKGVAGILSEPVPEVYVHSLADSAVLINAEVFYKYPGGSSLNQLKNQCLIAIKEQLEAANIVIAYPVRTLQFPKEFLEAWSGRSQELRPVDKFQGAKNDTKQVSMAES